MNAESKKWSFTWTTTRTKKKLPDHKILYNFLNGICESARFQLEAGPKNQKPHYQGYFVLLSRRQSKSKVLNKFCVHFKDVTGLTLSKNFDNLAAMNYAVKEEGRLAGPWFCGSAEAYDEKIANMKLLLWHKQLYSLLLKLKNLETLSLPEDQMKILWHMRGRGILLIEDPAGATSKTFFTRYLRQGQVKLKARKLPISSVDRLTSAVVRLSKENPIPDIFMIDMPRVVGESLSLKDLFHALEDLKGGYLVDSMYGKYSEGFFNEPILVIFTNHPISMYRRFSSKDRWYHYKIELKNDELGLTCYELGYFEILTNRGRTRLIANNSKNLEEKI